MQNIATLQTNARIAYLVAKLGDHGVDARADLFLEGLKVPASAR